MYSCFQGIAPSGPRLISCRAEPDAGAGRIGDAWRKVRGGVNRLDFDPEGAYKEITDPVMDKRQPASGRKKARIMLVDDHPMIRAGLASMLGNEQIAAETASGRG